MGQKDVKGDSVTVSNLAKTQVADQIKTLVSKLNTEKRKAEQLGLVIHISHYRHEPKESVTASITEITTF